MKTALEIVAGSWPIAVMFIAFVGGVVGLRIVSAIRRSAQEDKALRAGTAVAVHSNARRFED